VRALAYKLLVLFVPFAALLGFVEYRLRHIPNTYSRTRAALEARLPSIELLTVGSSHAQCAFEPSSLPVPAFNLAHGSQSLYYDAKLIEHYAPEAKNLWLVIFTLSYFSFESRLDRSVESWRSGFYREAFGIEPEGGQGRAVSDYSYIALYTPNVAFDLVLRDLVNPGVDGDTGAEGGPAARKAAAAAAAGGHELNDEFGIQRVRFHEAGMSREVARYNKAVLLSACERLSALGVAAAFVSTPVHRTYSDHMNPEIYARMQADAKEIAAACRGSYHNYMSDTRFEADDFINSDHLNARGAGKFSRIVGDDVVRPLMPRSATGK
jgi:hypothetical protein